MTVMVFSFYFKPRWLIWQLYVIRLRPKKVDRQTAPKPPICSHLSTRKPLTLRPSLQDPTSRVCTLATRIEARPEPRQGLLL
jgi:hypothetical protein